MLVGANNNIHVKLDVDELKNANNNTNIKFNINRLNGKLTI